MHHHRARARAQPRHLRVRGRRRHEQARKHPRVEIGDDGAACLDTLPVGESTPLAPPLAVSITDRLRSEPYFASRRFERAHHGRDDRIGAALADHHAEILVGHRFEIGKQRPASDVGREIEVHAPGAPSSP